MEKLFDRYGWEARLKPAFLVLLPLALAGIAWYPDLQATAKPVIALAGSAGGLVLLGQIARGAGKRLQERLLQEWRVFPSSQLLRHRDDRLDAGTKERYHRRLERMLNLKLPTPAEEAGEPERADSLYEACRTALLVKTRDQKTFNLLFKENISYGFRRNLVGLRGTGIVFSLLGLVGAMAKIGLAAKAHEPLPALAVLAAAGCCGMCGAWVCFLHVAWVRQAALDYALRLLETIDLLPGGIQSTRRPRASTPAAKHV